MSEPADKPSFSPGRRWSIGLNVVLSSVIVLAVVAMVNYLNRDYYHRFNCSLRTRNPLSERTVRFLDSLTNQVKVTLYYDKDDPMFSTVADLLNEYRMANSKIKVLRVDYIRDPGAAQKVKNDYKLGAGTDKNLVIFDCDGRAKAIPGDALAKYTLEQLPNEKEPKFRRKAVAFLGEVAFTAALLDVTDPKPHVAYFLTGHGEHSLESGDELTGYMKFGALLQQNRIQVQPLSLLNTNPIPTNCNLLIIARPLAKFDPSELDRIEQYLNRGGRLLALFDFEVGNRDTGLEKVLAKWGVGVGNEFVQDPENTMTGSDVIVSAYSKHALVNPLVGSGLYLVRPRSVSPLGLKAAPADAPRVEALAFSGPKSVLDGSPRREPQRYPLMVAVEKGAIQGVITERATTRIVVTGDSIFLANHQLDLLANRDFASYAANWLLERTELLRGLGAKPVLEYRVVMSKSQLQATEALLLGGLPGAILVLGSLVWLRRRR